MALAHSTTTDMTEVPSGLLFVPLGATEQHGPHLPLSTDTIIAESWAGATAKVLADQHDITVSVAPALPYGSSGEHQAFPGTLSIGHEALHQVLVELVRSAAIHHRGVVFFCGHGGNAATTLAVVQQLNHERHNVIALHPQWDPKEFGSIDAHAGRAETSLMLHLSPGLVRREAAEPGNTAPLRALIDRLQQGGVAEVSANGVLGDPTEATADEGRRMFAALVAQSADSVMSFVRSAKPHG